METVLIFGMDRSCLFKQGIYYPVSIVIMLVLITAAIT